MKPDSIKPGGTAATGLCCNVKEKLKTDVEIHHYHGIGSKNRVPFQQTLKITIATIDELQKLNRRHRLKAHLQCRTKVHWNASGADKHRHGIEETTYLQLFQLQGWMDGLFTAYSTLKGHLTAQLQGYGSADVLNA